MLEQLLGQCQEFIWALWIAFWVGCSLLVATWRLSQTTRYLREALGREMRTSSAAQERLINALYARSSKMQTTLLEAFLRAPTPTLNELAESTDREQRVRASRPPSAPLRATLDETTIELNTSDFTPPSLGSRGTPRNNQ